MSPGLLYIAEAIAGGLREPSYLHRIKQALASKKG
jgi:hypothetical protein